MKIASVALALVVGFAAPARADKLMCTDAAGIPDRQAKIAEANGKARDVALAAAGLKYIDAPIVATGPLAAGSTIPGNLVWIKLRVSCEPDVAGMVVFATDKAGKAYRVMPKLTSRPAPIYVCGTQTCEPACTTPPTEKSYAFKLPDKAVYSGERAVAWKTQVARLDYEQPASCPAPGAKLSEVEKLRAENAALRAENAKLQKQVDELNAVNKAEIERLRKTQKSMSGAKDLK